MKNKLNYILLLLLSLSIVSCVDTYDDDFSERNLQNGWIQFERPSDGVLLPYEGEVSSIQVILESLNQNGTTFNYTLEVVEGDANIETGNFQGEVLESQRIGLIEVPVDFDAEDGYVIQLSITDVERDGIAIGVADGDNSNPDHTPGTYTLTYAPFPQNTYAAVASVDGDEITQFEIDLVATANPREFNMNSMWGPDFVASITGDASLSGQFVYPGTLTVEDDNRSVSLVSSDTSQADPDDDDSPLRFPGTTVDGIHQINAETGVITYTLGQNLFGGDFEIDVVLTPMD